MITSRRRLKRRLAAALRQRQRALSRLQAAQRRGELDVGRRQAFVRGEYATARHLLDESLALRHTIGDRWGIAEAIVPLSMVALAQADDQLAYALW